MHPCTLEGGVIATLQSFRSSGHGTRRASARETELGPQRPTGSIATRGTQMQSTELRGLRPRLMPLALAIATAAAGALYTDVALVQAQPIDEIVVTARFREENLQEIPPGVTAIS